MNGHVDVYRTAANGLKRIMIFALNQGPLGAVSVCGNSLSVCQMNLAVAFARLELRLNLCINLRVTGAGGIPI